MIVDLLFQDATMWKANEQIHSCQELWFWTVRLCSTGFSRSESSALGLADKRSALEAMALTISLSATKTHLHWVQSEAQLADVMTKSSRPGRNILKKS